MSAVTRRLPAPPESASPHHHSSPTDPSPAQVLGQRLALHTPPTTKDMAAAAAIGGAMAASQRQAPPQAAAPTPDVDMMCLDRMHHTLTSGTQFVLQHLKPLETAQQGPGGATGSLSGSPKRSGGRSAATSASSSPRGHLAPLAGGAAASGSGVDDLPDFLQAVTTFVHDSAGAAGTAASAAKPSISFASMIAMAIVESPGNRLTVREIYAWMKLHFPFYARGEAGSGWKNSVRHNLSLNSNFVRKSREEGQPQGKGSFWMLCADSLAQIQVIVVRLRDQIPDASPAAAAFLNAAASPKPVMPVAKQSSRKSAAASKRHRRQRQRNFELKEVSSVSTDEAANMLLAMTASVGRRAPGAPGSATMCETLPSPRGRVGRSRVSSGASFYSMRSSTVGSTRAASAITERRLGSAIRGLYAPDAYRTKASPKGAAASGGPPSFLVQNSLTAFGEQRQQRPTAPVQGVVPAEVIPPSLPGLNARMGRKRTGSFKGVFTFQGSMSTPRYTPESSSFHQAIKSPPHARRRIDVHSEVEESSNEATPIPPAELDGLAAVGSPQRGALANSQPNPGAGSSPLRLAVPKMDTTDDELSASAALLSLAQASNSGTPEPPERS